MLYVKANLEHQFSNISEDLKILVWFSGSPKTDHGLNWKKWTKNEFATKSTLKENVWNKFIDLPTLVAGLYQLPQTLGGDSVLPYKADEINYVVKGKAKFRVGEEATEVYPGSVIWVEAGNGHKFYDLEDDFEVYIMFVDND